LCLACILAAGATTAQERTFADRGAMFPTSSFFSIDFEGGFRLRTELWHDVHMGLSHVNKYGIYPQLSDSSTDGSRLREATDFRLRLAPALGIGEKAKVLMVVDLFSVQAGEGGWSSTALEFMNYYAIDPPGSFDSPLDSASIRALWAEVDLFHIVTAKFGRLPAHFGMGLVENDGSGMDMDGGDVVDSIALTADLAGYELFLSWDWPLEGYNVENPFSPWGEPHDPGDLDDILQFRFVVSQHLDNPKHAEFFGWGVYNRLRWQDFSSLGTANAGNCQQSPWASEYGCTELMWRDAFVWTPSGWVKVIARLSDNVAFRLEAELAGRYGTISATRMLPQEGSHRTLYGIGGALKTDLVMPGVVTGLEFGAGSGDSDSMAFGILDGPVIGEPDVKPGEEVVGALNDTLTSFSLHPNYHTDLLLFRRVIGAITNAWYLKVHARFDLLDRESSALWLAASVLYARAWVASSTPGDSKELGVEADLALGAELGSHVQAKLEGGLLVPFDGLTNASKLENPLPWTVRLLLNFSF